jgi:hypothetical protein
MTDINPVIVSVMPLADIQVTAPDPFVTVRTFGTSDLGELGAGPSTFYQRIRDNTLGQFVYYTLAEITSTPLSGETQPNHADDLDPATHVVIEER